MPFPQKYWYCDVCGQVIDSNDDGYLIWDTDSQQLAHSFMLIHNGKCDNEDYPRSTALANLVGTDGLNRLLSFLSVGTLHSDEETPSTPRVKNMDEFVDLVRRIHIPLYEDARKKFHNKRVIESASDMLEWAPYTTSMLTKICRGDFDE